MAVTEVPTVPGGHDAGRKSGQDPAADISLHRDPQSSVVSPGGAATTRAKWCGPSDNYAPNGNGPRDRGNRSV